MAKTVIGLFDEHSEAQRVVDDLMSNGFDQDEVIVTHDTDDLATTKLLTAAQVPEQDMRFYNQGIRQGGTVVLVRTDDNQAQLAADIMSKYNLVDVNTRLSEYQTAGMADMRLTDIDESGTVIPVVEEELKVGKRQVQRGGIRVHSRITETPIEEQVTLRHEKVHVERRPVDRPVSDAEINSFQEGTIEMTEMAEEAVVAKRARIVEEVVIGKDVHEHTETIRDSVRRTDVDVQDLGSERSVGSSGFETFATDFRGYYDTNLASSGYSYDEYTPVYRYGYDLASDKRYSSSDWSTVESDARTRWEERNPGTWDQFKDTVRYAWDKARGKQ